MTKENKELYSKLYYDDVVKRLPSFKGRENTIPPPELKEKSSKDLTELVIGFLKLNGHHAVEQKTTGKRIDKRKESIDVFGNKRIVGSVIWAKSTDEVGRADILAKIMVNIMDKIIPISVELEIKWQKDFQSNKQIEFQNKLESKGGLYFIIKTFDQFIEWYYNFINQYTMKQLRSGTKLYNGFEIPETTIIHTSMKKRPFRIVCTVSNQIQFLDTGEFHYITANQMKHYL